MNLELKERLKKVKMLMLDVDGVLTNGAIIYDEEGREWSAFHTLDGMGIKMVQSIKIEVVFVSARKSESLVKRAEELKVKEVHQNEKEKRKVLQKMIRKYRLKSDQVCYVGDDLLDLPVLKRAGVAIAVQNAVQEVKRHVHWVTCASGGRGAIREVTDAILKAQGKWGTLMDKYLR